MPAPKKVSARQTEVLLSFMEANKDLATARITHEGGPRGKQWLRDRWCQLAESLNSVGNGATKSHQEWRVYWNNLKYKAKLKAVERMNHLLVEGSGASSPWRKGNLTDEESRIVAVLGKESVYGDKSVHVPSSDSEDEPSNEARETGVNFLGNSHTEKCQPTDPLVIPQTSPSPSPTLPCPPTTSAPLPSVPPFPTRHTTPHSTTEAGLSTRQEPLSRRRPHVGCPITTPDVIDWARATDERNAAAQERIAEALEGILEVQTQILRTLHERLPRFKME